VLKSSGQAPNKDTDMSLCFFRLKCLMAPLQILLNVSEILQLIEIKRNYLGLISCLTLGIMHLGIMDLRIEELKINQSLNP
jgi:hypothetical protein